MSLTTPLPLKHVLVVQQHACTAVSPSRFRTQIGALPLPVDCRLCTYVTVLSCACVYILCVWNCSSIVISLSLSVSLSLSLSPSASWFVCVLLFQDDRYFLSGSLDGKLRLWNIPDKKVALWNEVDGQTRLITAANFCQNGKYAVIGTYDGRCIFYDTEVCVCVCLHDCVTTCVCVCVGVCEIGRAHV